MTLDRLGPLPGARSLVSAAAAGSVVLMSTGFWLTGLGSP